MFTGIIEEVGEIRSLHIAGKTAVVEIEAKQVSEGLQPGESVSVNGVCLTVRRKSSRSFQAEISSETLSRTSFSMLKEGSAVNLERPLLPTSRLGGHFVQGHVDGIGRVTEIRSEGDFALPWTESA
jgi:riboflavin synthase